MKYIRNDNGKWVDLRSHLASCGEVLPSGWHMCMEYGIIIEKRPVKREYGYMDI